MTIDATPRPHKQTALYGVGRVNVSPCVPIPSVFLMCLTILRTIEKSRSTHLSRSRGAAATEKLLNVKTRMSETTQLRTT